MILHARIPGANFVQPRRHNHAGAGNSTHGYFGGGSGPLDINQHMKNLHMHLIQLLVFQQDYLQCNMNFRHQAVVRMDILVVDTFLPVLR